MVGIRMRGTFVASDAKGRLSREVLGVYLGLGSALAFIFGAILGFRLELSRISVRVRLRFTVRLRIRVRL